MSSFNDFVKYSYYPECDKSISKIVDALKSVGESDTSFWHRKRIAAANDIYGYAGKPIQNNRMLDLLQRGQLKKA